MRHLGSTSGQGAEAVGAALEVEEEMTELNGAVEVYTGATELSAALLAEAVHRVHMVEVDVTKIVETLGAVRTEVTPAWVTV